MGRQVSHPMMKRQRTACMRQCVDARLRGLAARYSPMGYKPFFYKAFFIKCILIVELHASLTCASE